MNCRSSSRFQFSFLTDTLGEYNYFVSDKLFKVVLQWLSSFWFLIPLLGLNVKLPIKKVPLQILSPYWFFIPLLGLFCKATNQKREYLYLGNFHTPLLIIFTQTSTHLAYFNHRYHCSLRFFHSLLIFQPPCLFETQESIWTESKLCRLLAQFPLTPNVNANFSP